MNETNRAVIVLLAGLWILLMAVLIFLAWAADADVVDRLTQATVQVMGDLSEPGKGILFVVPVTRVLGLRPPPRRPPS